MKKLLVGCFVLGFTVLSCVGPTDGEPSDTGETPNVGSVTDGLVAEWVFSDAAGFGSDSSGNSYDGVAATALTPVTFVPPPAEPTTDRDGNTDEAILFSSSWEQYFAAPTSSPPFDPADFSQGVAISFWVQPGPNPDRQGLLVKGPSGRTSNDEVEIGFLSAKLGGDLYLLAGGTAVVGIDSTKLTAGSWHHVVFSWDAATETARAWHNGVVAATATSIDSLPVGTGSLWFARPMDSGFDYFDGAADDLRLYKRGLSQADVDLLYDL